MTDDPVRTNGGTAETPPAEADANEPAGLVDDIEDSLSDEGFDVFHGREFISLRESGELGPNSTVTKRYLEGAEAVMLAYNEEANEIVIIPLAEKYDKPNVYGLHDSEQPTIAARIFLKTYGLLPETTLRYTPEYDETLGPDAVDGGLRIDLDQDAEKVAANHRGDDGDE